MPKRPGLVILRRLCCKLPNRQAVTRLRRAELRSFAGIKHRPLCWLYQVAQTMKLRLDREVCGQPNQIVKTKDIHGNDVEIDVQVLYPKIHIAMPNNSHTIRIRKQVDNFLDTIDRVGGDEAVYGAAVVDLAAVVLDRDVYAQPVLAAGAAAQ